MTKSIYSKLIDYGFFVKLAIEAKKKINEIIESTTNETSSFLLPLEYTGETGKSFNLTLEINLSDQEILSLYQPDFDSRLHINSYEDYNLKRISMG